MAGLHSAPSADGLAPYSTLDPPGGYPLTNVWPDYALGPPDGSASGGGAGEATNGLYSGGGGGQQRQDWRHAEFQIDPALSSGGGGGHHHPHHQLPAHGPPSWAPMDHSPSATSSDSPVTSSSGSAPTPPQPSTLPPGSAADALAPLPSPSSFFPPFSPSAFFNPAAFPPGSSGGGGGGGGGGIGGYFPAPSPLGQGALPFSPGQFLSQFNFGDGAAGGAGNGASGGLLSPGAENHPEAGFLFDGLLSPTSLLPLPLPSTSPSSSDATTSNGGGPNRPPTADTNGADDAGRAKLREMEREEQRLIEGGAWLVPERKMLSSEGGLRAQRGGMDSYTVSPMDPFYIDPQKFGGCYAGPCRLPLVPLSLSRADPSSLPPPRAVEHWQLPPLRILSKVAKRTITQLIPHMPFVHVPSFALNKVPGCVGFAISSCGRPLRNRVSGAGGQDGGGDGGDGLGEGGSWDRLKSVVRTEKTDMLVRVRSLPLSPFPFGWPLD